MRRTLMIITVALVLCLCGCSEVPQISDIPSEPSQSESLPIKDSEEISQETDAPQSSVDIDSLKESGTVPQALMAFFESESFEDAIRNAISIGGDSDTLAAITGGIAEAYYGIPESIRKHALTFLDQRLLSILNAFEQKYGIVAEKNTASGKKTVKYVPAGTEHTSPDKSDETARQVEILNAVSNAVVEDKDSVDWKKTTSTMLFNHLFEACNILRGPINQDEFKTYVIPLLFFKRVSDTYDEETQLAIEEYGDDVADFDEDEIHKFIIPDGCHWDDVRMNSENVGAAIVNAMIGIERANPDNIKYADHIIHTVGPVYSGKKKDAELLNDCYYNSIELAYQNGCKSIAFPGISTGVYGYPLDEAARVSLLAAVHWLDAHKDTVMNIYFCCFKDAELSAYRKLTQ